jgi:hypothetical protein
VSVPTATAPVAEQPLEDIKPLTKADGKKKKTAKEKVVKEKVSKKTITKP